MWRSIETLVDSSIVETKSKPFLFTLKDADEELRQVWKTTLPEVICHHCYATSQEVRIYVEVTYMYVKKSCATLNCDCILCNISLLTLTQNFHYTQSIQIVQDCSTFSFRGLVVHFKPSRKPTSQAYTENR